MFLGIDDVRMERTMSRFLFQNMTVCFNFTIRFTYSIWSFFLIFRVVKNGLKYFFCSFIIYYSTLRVWIISRSSIPIFRMWCFMFQIIFSDKPGFIELFIFELLIPDFSKNPSPSLKILKNDQISLNIFVKTFISLQKNPDMISTSRSGQELVLMHAQGCRHRFGTMDIFSNIYCHGLRLICSVKLWPIFVG